MFRCRGGRSALCNICDQYLRSRRLVPQGRVRSHSVVAISPPLDQHLGLLQRAEDFAVEQFVTQLPVEAFNVPVLRRAPRLDDQRLDADPAQPVPTFLCRNSGPLSPRMWSGTPRVANSHVSRSSKSSLLSRRAASMSMYSVVNSSTAVSILNALPSRVRAVPKSNAHT